jgi:hypothetical protein
MSDSEDESHSKSYEIFSQLQPSTISMNGFISDVDPDERKDIKRMKCIGRIVEISGNFGCVSTPEYEDYRKSSESANKKKKKEAKQKERDKKSIRVHSSRGTGTHQSSQITFVIKSDIRTKKGVNRFYKIKLFRKGSVQIPGVVDSSYQDVAKALNYLVNYLREFYKNPNIRMTQLYTTMKNYICSMVYDYFRINLTKLKEAIDAYKKDSGFRGEVNKVLEIIGFPKVDLEQESIPVSDEDDTEPVYENLPRVPKSVGSKKKGHRYTPEGLRDIVRIMCGNTREMIAEVIRDTDKSVSSVTIKFYSTDHSIGLRTKEAKKISIKVFLLGKLDIEGGNDRNESEKLRLFMTKFIRDRQSTILGNVKQPYTYDPNSSDSGESTYADFVHEKGTKRRSKAHY